MNPPTALPSTDYTSVFQHAPIGIILTTLDGHIIDCNPAAQQLLDRSLDTLTQMTINQIIHHEDQHIDQHLQQDLIHYKRQSYQIEKRYLDAHNQTSWGYFHVSQILKTAEHPASLMFMLENINERKNNQDQLFQEAFHDTLTGLPNRALFSQHLHQAFRHTSRFPDKRFAILFLDLNHFKHINDTYGHDTGDILLIDFSRRVEECLRVSDIMARLSGDEFIILLQQIRGTHDVTHAAERIIQALDTPFDIHGQRIDASVSIGIALSSLHYKNPEDLIHNADVAMYQAKTNCYSSYVVYSEEMHHHLNSLKKLKTDLEHALTDGHFQLYYQPIIDLNTHEVIGFESLVRWIHPEKGLILPIDFIVVAEQVGMISRLDEWIIRTHCQQLKTWLDNPHFNDIHISVNVSTRLFTQPDFIRCIEHILSETGLPAKYLLLEITERAFMEKLDTTLNVLHDLRERGISLTIDDFGTGHFALNCLYQYPIQTLKIDGIFTSQLETKHASREIVRATVHLAKTFDIQVVAENIETEQQAKALVDLGCQYGQGYYFHEPVNLQQAEALLTSQ